MTYASLEDTVYFHFASNNTSGSGDDGATPAAHVRLCGAAADAAPVLSPTPYLLTHANYPAGCYEVAIEATAVNGFAVGADYAVFVTLAADSQNPTGMIGEFQLKSLASLVLGEDFVNIDEMTVGGRNLLNAQRLLRNKHTLAAATLTVMREDDTTTAWTATLTSDAAAEPITGVDPA